MSREEKMGLLLRMRRQLQALSARLPSSRPQAEHLNSGPTSSAPRPQAPHPQPDALACMCAPGIFYHHKLNVLVLPLWDFWHKKCQ